MRTLNRLQGRVFPSLGCPLQRKTYLSCLKFTSQTDEYFIHTKILSEFTLILGWGLNHPRIQHSSVAHHTNPYPVCIQLWAQRYQRSSLKCKSHSFQGKYAVPDPLQSWPVCGGGGVERRWGELAREPVHTPLVESELGAM